MLRHSCGQELTHRSRQVVLRLRANMYRVLVGRDCVWIEAICDGRFGNVKRKTIHSVAGVEQYTPFAGLSNFRKHTTIIADDTPFIVAKYIGNNVTWAQQRKLFRDRPIGWIVHAVK